MFHPALWDSLRGYSGKQFVSDLIAGMVVGIVALPLAMAFAIASGVPPETGLYTAIVAGFLISALGGSRVQIGGPTGAFVVLVYDIVQRHGIDGLAICTLMAGGIILAMGLCRLGTALKYIPYPVITGFTSGIAVIIFSSQIKDLLGLTTGPLPGEVFGKWAVYFENLATINGAAVGLSALCIAIIVLLRRYYPRVPAALIAMVAAAGLVQAFHLPVETIGSRFGGIPAALPQPHVPAISWERIQELWSPALSVALLGAIESLLSAVVADGMIGSRHHSNTELIAQGIANICSPLFGGLPATGAIARTATNVKNGGRTPVAGIVHAVTLLLLMVACGGLASLAPMCSLASILVVVAYHMSEWQAFAAMFRAPKRDVAILLTTFGLTVAFDLIIAVQIGVILGAFLFIRRMADLTTIGEIGQGDPSASSSEKELDRDPESLRRWGVPEEVDVYGVHGHLCFGAADKLRNVMAETEAPPKVMILRLRHVTTIDATGLNALTEFHKECRRRGTHLILSGGRPHIMRKLDRWKLAETLGEDNVAENIDRAIRRAREVIAFRPSEAGQELRHKVA